jgi:hypothetical protein
MPAKIPTVRQEKHDLVEALDDLRTVVQAIPKEYDYVFHPGKQLFFTYLKGIVYGLGALTAVAIVLPVIVSVLQHVQWVPLVGDFVKDVSSRLEQTQGR